MANVALPPALAKMLLAIAWADGELHAEEEATIKEVMGLLPSVSAQEWALIELYFVAPVQAEERAELLQQVIGFIRSAADRRIALDAIDAMLKADGLVQPGEEAVAQHFRAVIAGLDVTPIGALGRTLGSMARSRPRREREFELWRANPVLYVVHTQPNTLAAVDGRAAEIAALAAGIMAQVARVAAATPGQERPELVQALQTAWRMPPTVAEAMADGALALTRRAIDYHRISRELVARTTEQQRVALLDTLFAIANAADQVAPDEIDEIRIIAERLQLTRQQFIAAKLKIPAAARGGL